MLHFTKHRMCQAKNTISQVLTPFKLILLKKQTTQTIRTGGSTNLKGEQRFPLAKMNQHLYNWELHYKNMGKNQ